MNEVYVSIKTANELNIKHGAVVFFRGTPVIAKIDPKLKSHFMIVLKPIPRPLNCDFDDDEF